MIAHATAARGISLRTGCMCNSGGAAALLGLKDAMSRLECGATLAAFERAVGEEVGIVRVSLGLASDFGDVCRVLAFAREVADERARGDMRIAWERDPATRLGVGYDSRA
jgi:molybdenum cofactor sulfurtransferase